MGSINSPVVLMQDYSEKQGLDTKNLEEGILLSSPLSSLLLLVKVSLLCSCTHLRKLTAAGTWTEEVAIQHIIVLQKRQCYWQSLLSENV